MILGLWHLDGARAPLDSFVLEGSTRMMNLMFPGSGPNDTTGRITPYRAGGQLFAARGHDAEELTATQPVPSVLVPTHDPEASRLYFVKQGIKGGRFLAMAMGSLLAFFVMWVASDMELVVWLVAAISASLLGLGIWESFDARSATLAGARGVRHLVVYFATTGTVFVLITVAAHAVLWWKATGQFIL